MRYLVINGLLRALDRIPRPRLSCRESATLGPVTAAGRSIRDHFSVIMRATRCGHFTLYCLSLPRGTLFHGFRYRIGMTKNPLGNLLGLLSLLVVVVNQNHVCTVYSCITYNTVPYRTLTNSSLYTAYDTCKTKNIILKCL